MAFLEATPSRERLSSRMPEPRLRSQEWGVLRAWGTADVGRGAMHARVLPAVLGHGAPHDHRDVVGATGVQRVL
jgi:hypothetical protein